MRMGLNWYTPADDALLHRLGVVPAYLKTSAEPCADLDFRTDLARVYREQLDARGFPATELIIDLRTEEVASFLRHPLRPAGGDPYSWFVDWCGEVVREARGCVRKWELWGEAACPYVGRDFDETRPDPSAHEGMGYVELLRRVATRIREVDPEARVLLGGHGCDMFLDFFERVMGAGGGDFFDVNNLHPFVLRYREWGAIEAMLRGGFARMAALSAHPLCATEFGWPTRPGDDLSEFSSHVVDRVVAISETQAAQWTNSVFRIFEEAGVEFVVWCHMRDFSGGHWGKHIGLLRDDGTPKGPLWDTWREWYRRGEH
jgi:hypothetical protein